MRNEQLSFSTHSIKCHYNLKNHKTGTLSQRQELQHTGDACDCQNASCERQ